MRSKQTVGNDQLPDTSTAMVNTAVTGNGFCIQVRTYEPALASTY